MTAARSNQSIAVLGAGSWGTALAIHLSRAGLDVTLWGNEPEHMRKLQHDRSNQQFLPDIVFPENLNVTEDLAHALRPGCLLLLAMPSHAFRSFLKSANNLIDNSMSVTWASKGLEEGTGKLLHQIVAEEVPHIERTAVMSGPTFAREVAMNMPTAITVASASESLMIELQNCLHSGFFRAYTSDDIIGVELGGALKNVLAIAAGIADGLGFGSNSRAALITRGLAEVMRLGETMGGRRETFMGLTGLGDLVLTCTDDQSRNRRMGLMLAQGKQQQAIKDKIGQEVEGVRTAREAMRLSRAHDIELPIIEQVYNVLYENVSPEDAVKQLFDRKSTSEIT